jgi:hypothetical protein
MEAIKTENSVASWVTIRCSEDSVTVKELSVLIELYALSVPFKQQQSGATQLNSINKENF